VESFSAFVPLGAPPEASPTTEADEPDEDSDSDSDRSRSSDSDSDSDSGDGSDRFGGIFGAPGTAPPGGLPAARPPPA
jgi:hypothetical protein